MTLVHSADQVIGSIPTEQAALSVADVLDRAADLIEPEGAWTQGAPARTAGGRGTDSGDREAVCFCAIGAINRAGYWDWPLTSACWKAVEDTTVGLAKWNDAPERTQAEVVAALRAAAEKARTASSVGTSNASEPNTPAVSS